MKLQPRARTGIALIAAYAVALQALLLAVIAPSAGMVTGTAEAAALPLCGGAAGHSTPAGHGQDCLDACLTGCCCGASLLPTPVRALRYAPRPLRVLSTSIATQGFVSIRVAKAHRSRAPPVA